MNKKKQIYLNYKRQHRFLGIIDYKTMLYMAIYIIVLIYILGFLQIQLIYKIYIFGFAVFPILSLILLNVNNKTGNTIDIIITILKYAISKKEYILALKYIKNLDAEYDEYKNSI